MSFMKRQWNKISFVLVVLFIIGVFSGCSDYEKIRKMYRHQYVYVFMDGKISEEPQVCYEGLFYLNVNNYKIAISQAADTAFNTPDKYFEQRRNHADIVLVVSEQKLFDTDCIEMD